MSEPNIIVLPVSDNSTQRGDQESAEIASTIENALHERTHPQPEHPGPFKQIIAHQDSLYKYINWEDPTRTLALYAGALSILFGVHYLPLTQVALKAGVIALGVVSVTEFASRSFSVNSLSIRLRPKEYKKFPESTLNATLKDIHDFVQYAIVEAQKIVFGQDLDKTFAGFLGFTALYWLIKIVPPFWLIVMGLTSIFVAPLGFSLQGRNAAHEASVRAQEMVNATTEKSGELVQNGKAKATELSSKGKQTAVDISAQAMGTASNISGTATEEYKKLPQMSTDTVNNAPGIVSSTTSDANGPNNTSPSNNIDGNFDRNRFVTSEAANRMSQLSSSTPGSTKQVTPDIYAGKQSESNHQQNTISSFPTQAGGKRIDSFSETGLHYAPATHGNLYLLRGTAHEEMYGTDDMN